MSDKVQWPTEAQLDSFKPTKPTKLQDKAESHGVLGAVGEALKVAKDYWMPPKKKTTMRSLGVGAQKQLDKIEGEY